MARRRLLLLLLLLLLGTIYTRVSHNRLAGGWSTEGRDWGCSCFLHQRATVLPSAARTAGAVTDVADVRARAMACSQRCRVSGEAEYI